MSDQSNFLLIGLKASGKTTFLAALWHVLESGELDGQLVVPALQADRTYLNAVRSSWLKLKPVGRTTMRAKNEIELTLEDRQNAKLVNILLPDLSGESFRLQWSTRKTTDSYAKIAKSAAGVFVFVHPFNVSKTSVIKPTAIDDQDEEDVESVGSIEPSINWTPAQSSTQVQLVELLQLLMYLRTSREKLKVAVIVSAWDVVHAKITPSAWLEARMPLLSQFVRANTDRLVSETFGVSAQGGDLSEHRGALLEADTPSKRCYSIAGASFEKVSIARPLEFLLESTLVVK